MGSDLKTNFLLVAFENVQPDNVGILNGRSFRIKVFVGANQAKIPFELARTLHAFGPDAEYVQVAGNGRNALDFHVAYYIGHLAAKNPDASFYVISKDKGFDPLIKHLKAQGISCQRLSSIADITGGKISSSKSGSDTSDAVNPFDSRLLPEKVQSVINNLTKLKAAKPRTLNALRSAINQVFKKNGLADTELEEIIEQLTVSGAVIVTGGKVTYERTVESKPSNSEPISDNVDAIIADLMRRKASRPKRIKTLRSTINALFKNKLAEAEIDELIEKLSERGVTMIADGKVTYELRDLDEIKGARLE